jgi:hypothetical protein
LRLRLAEHQPRLQILAPADDAVLPIAPWSLDLSLEDWPLADAGALGLGAHLVVQLDDQAPLRLGPKDPKGPTNKDTRVSVAMAPLSPGSHRLTVYAARPWGEAVKDPGAAVQIRLHGLAANPLSQPLRGTPQLVSSTPSDLIHHEPVLIDWLLIDAPLQPLEGDGSNWRLRVTLNGDSFQVDRQEPLWLTGLRSGSNPLQLELLDGLGEPLNPPFNSLVQDLVMRPEDPHPWQTASISAEDLKRLLGELPREPAGEITPSQQPVEAAGQEPKPRTELDLQAEGMATDRSEAATSLTTASTEQPLEEEVAASETAPEPDAATEPEVGERRSFTEPAPVMPEPVEPVEPVDAPDPLELLAPPGSAEPQTSPETLGSAPLKKPSEEPAAKTVMPPEASASPLDRLRARFGA